jgi:hypothetical protein
VRIGGDPGPRPAGRFPRLDGSSSSGRSAVITGLTLLLIVDVRGTAFYTAWTLIGLALVSEGRRNDGCTCGAYAAAAARDALPERAFGVHDGGAVGVEAPSSRGARPAGLKAARLCAGGRSSGG